MCFRGSCPSLFTFVMYRLVCHGHKATSNGAFLVTSCLEVRQVFGSATTGAIMDTFFQVLTILYGITCTFFTILSYFFLTTHNRESITILCGFKEIT